MRDLQRYEAMAKLRLRPEERTWVTERAEALIRGFDELARIDDGGAQPLVTVLPVTNVLREDTAAKLLPRDELLANAPEQYDGYFQVPKTIE